MVDVVEKIEALGGGELWAFHCPGCGYGHWFRTGAPERPNWTWNKDVARPTVLPSILVNPDAGMVRHGRCHLFIEKGTIRFLEDCWHDLRGQVVPLEPV